MRASSAPGRRAIARYSDAIATQSSVSAITAGLQAIGSRSTAKPSSVPTRRCRSRPGRRGRLQRLVQRCRPRACARSGSRPPPRCRCRSGTRCPRGAALRRRRLWLTSEPLWTRQRSSPVENGCEPCGRDARSRSPSGCGRWRGCPACRRGRSAAQRRAAAPSPCRSRSRAGAHHAQVGVAGAQPACASAALADTPAWRGWPGPRARLAAQLPLQARGEAPAKSSSGWNQDSLQAPAGVGLR